MPNNKHWLRAARLVSDREIVVPCGVGSGDERPNRCHTISRAYAEKSGGSVVHGFQVSAALQADIAVLFRYHTLVRTAAGELVDPNYAPGDVPPFLECPDRPFDYERNITWNDIAVSARPFRTPVTGKRMSAWAPLWKTMVGDTPVFSTDPRHARRRLFDGYEPGIRDYVASLGLDPEDIVDIVFSTNVEAVAVAFAEGEEPPEHVKDYQRTNLRVPHGVQMRPASQVLSEREEEELRQFR